MPGLLFHPKPLPHNLEGVLFFLFILSLFSHIPQVAGRVRGIFKQWLHSPPTSKSKIWIITDSRSWLWTAVLTPLFTRPQQDWTMLVLVKKSNPQKTRYLGLNPAPSVFGILDPWA